MGQTGTGKWKTLPWLCGAVILAVASAQELAINICSGRDVTFPSFGGQLGAHGIIYYNISKPETYQSTAAPCVTRFTVRPDSGVNLTLRQNNFRGCHYATKREISAAKSKNCDSRCTYLFAYDPNYFNASVKYFFSGESWGYMAMSKRSVVGLCMSTYDQSINRVNFTMAYLVTTKTLTILGSSLQSTSSGMFRSVNFPEGYVTDGDTYTYMIQSLNQNDFIKLTFDDWDLDRLSLIEFEGANVERFEGSDDRPYVISTKSWIQLKFSTGNQYGSIYTRSMGFKVTYTMTADRKHDDISTDCGGYKLDSTGGVLQFSGPATTYRLAHYDCVWVIKRQPAYDKVFLRLIDSTIYRSSEWKEPNRLQVYDGLTSDSKNVRSFPPESTDAAKRGFKSTEAFYVRLKGSFYQDDKFKMAFASYSSLPAGSDQCTYGLFTCGNKRCIDQALKCDGADQCGDNSDENSCPSSDSWLPQGTTPFSLSISIIIPIVVAMFLVIVICLFVVFVRRCQQLQRRQPNRNSQVPSVSGRMARGRRTRRSQIRVTIQQEYEDAPPTYEEAIGTPPNLGYFNMAFMWSQPDIATGLMSPPPYAEVIGGADEESGGTTHYPVENDPNRQLTATDSLHSRRARERREAQVQTRDTERQVSSQLNQQSQSGLLRRNSNTPSSGTNSLEHGHSLGRQPLRVPVEAVYGNTLQQRNKTKDTASPQISVTNEGDKDSPQQSTASVQTPHEVPESGAGVHSAVGQASTPSAANATGPVLPPHNPHSAGKLRGGKGHRRRNRQRNAPAPARDDLGDSNSAPGPNGRVLHPQPQATMTLGENSSNSLPPRLLRQSYSQADIPTSVEWTGPPDPRRASSAARLYPDERPIAERAYRETDTTIRSQLSPVPQEEAEHESEPHPALPPLASSLSTPSRLQNQSREEVCDAEEEEYRQRLSQSSQQLRLFLRRSNSEDEDMFV